MHISSVKRVAALGAVAAFLLAGLAALEPNDTPWIYVTVAVSFELWLFLRIVACGRAPVPSEEAPYGFTAEEASLVARYRFYFTYAGVAAGAASVLSALGLASLVLTPWLLLREAYVPASIIGLNLFFIARLTRTVAPLVALRQQATRGNHEARVLLEAHAPAWAKIHAANAPQRGGGRL